MYSLALTAVNHSSVDDEDDGRQSAKLALRCGCVKLNHALAECVKVYLSQNLELSGIRYKKLTMHTDEYKVQMKAAHDSIDEMNDTTYGWLEDILDIERQVREQVMHCRNMVKALQRSENNVSI